MPFHYVRRALELRLVRAARQFPAVVLTGPRQSGKSTLLSHLFPKHAYATLDDPGARAMARRDPRLFLSDLGPRAFIDEIQYAPGLLSYVKMAVDRHPAARGRFILTGSQIFPLMAGISESLAGRAAVFELLGFSWGELPAPMPESPRLCFRRIFEGFYPRPALQGGLAREYYSSYLQTYLERDVRQIKAVHDLSIFQSFLELLAARAGSLLNLSEVAKECGISQANARHWLSLLEATRIVYPLRPYHRNISKRVVKRPKVYFTDTGLLSYLLKYPDAETLRAGPMAGAVFENMIAIEFLKQKLNYGRPYELYFLRDSNGVEADLLLDWGRRIDLVEIKSAMTIPASAAGPIEALGKALKIPFRGAVLSFFEGSASLTGRVKALPWRRLEEVAAGR